MSKEKILKGLKDTYSNLGLSEDVLTQYTEVVAGLAGDADDAKIAEIVAGAGAYLKSVQAQMDRRVEDARKKFETKSGDTKPAAQSEEMSKVLQLLEAQAESNKQMAERLQKLEGLNEAKERDAMLNRIGAEMGLNGEFLEMAKLKLSGAEDEEAIKNSFGATKQMFIKAGMKVDRDASTVVAEDEAAKKAAEDWVEQMAKAQASI